MIKRCPSCNRTYSDESISFCLADGALLSAPYDAIREEAPPTEILPAEERPVASRPVPPTEPPKAAVPTMTSLGGQNYAPSEVRKPESKRRSYGFIWAAIALLVVGGIVIGILSLRRALNRQTEAVATSSPETLLAGNTSSPPDNSQAPTTTTSTATAPETSRSNVNANQSETKTSSPQPEAKVIFSPAPPAPGRAEPLAPPPANNQTAETKQPEAIDYNRVFSQREVDVKPQLLERPKPSYTDSARQNNVQGKVVLRVVLSANGSVGSISAISGLSHGLTEQAIAAARRIKFSPAIKDGRPVSVAVNVEYNFSVY